MCIRDSYSTDREWLVPHFEKMLYDQAQLLALYGRAYALTEDPLYRDAIEGTIAYLNQRLKTPEGAFYSAEDADSSVPGKEDVHAEGAFYVWTHQELAEILNQKELEQVVSLFGVSEEGNANGDASGELTGKNVLFLKEKALSAEQRELANKLKLVRDQRKRPHRDDKVLTEWNAMLAAALADCGRFMEKPEYLASAQEILDFVESKLSVDGNLKRSYLEGGAEIDAFSIDHAQLVHAYLALFQAGGNPAHLRRAIHWQGILDQEFWDAENDGYFDTRASSKLLYRRKTQFDGATISTSSMSALNLSKLYEITGDKNFADRLQSLLKQVGTTLERAPTGLPGALSALLQWHGNHESLIVISKDDDWKSTLQPRYTPHKTLILVDSNEKHRELKELIPFLPPWSDNSRAYLCRGFSCGLPIEKLKDVLD